MIHWTGLAFEFHEEMHIRRENSMLIELVKLCARLPCILIPIARVAFVCLVLL